MMTLAIIGGSQKRTIKKQAKKAGLTVIFHDGVNSREDQYRSIVNKADSVVVMTGACSHRSMWLVKDIAKKMDKPIAYNRGFGVSGAINLGVQAYQNRQQKKSENKRSVAHG